jgi:F0F1-type ATP synthase membrane subunit c/vacuolar-type H+-ATPase subunit K
MDPDTLRRLHYAAAIACGVFAALVVHILLTVFGLGLDAVLRDAATGSKQQFVSAMAWWAIGGAAFAGGWAAGAYLIAAAREREFIYRLAQRFLIGLVFVAATIGGIMSKTGNLGGTVDVIAGLAALGLVLRRAARLPQRRTALAADGPSPVPASLPCVVHPDIRAILSITKDWNQPAGGDTQFHGRTNQCTTAQGLQPCWQRPHSPMHPHPLRRNHVKT